jgi:hypothetical protein
MSRLYASIDSDARKTQATSRGHKRIDAHVRGWDNGVEVVANGNGGKDVFYVYATGGSNAPSKRTLVAVIGGDAMDMIAAEDNGARYVYGEEVSS